MKTYHLKIAGAFLLITATFFADPGHAQTILSSNYTDCAMPSASTAIFSNGYSYIFITRDTGRTWYHQKTPVALEFINFPDTMTGFGSVRNSFDLWKSIDGGISWNIVATFPGPLLSGLEDELAPFYFVTSKLGFAWGSWGVKRTSDGGSSWDDITSQFYYHLFPLNQMAFIDQENGVAITLWHDILHTSDGGITWDVVNPGGYTPPEYRLATRGSSGYAMTGSTRPQPGSLESWIDVGEADGVTWTQTYYNNGNDLTAVVPQVIGFFSESRGIALPYIYDNKTYFISRDGGQHWLKRIFPGEIHPVACGLDRSGIGFVVGNGLDDQPIRVAKTTDYGETWIQIDKGNVEVHTDDIPAAQAFAMSQNYPNPFGVGSCTTFIPVELRQRAHATLRVHDMLGRPVLTVFDGMLDAGRHDLPFTAPSSLPAGMYSAVLMIDGVRTTMRMTVMR